MPKARIKPAPWFINLANAKLPVEVQLGSRKEADRLRRHFYAMRQRMSDPSPWESIKVRVLDGNIIVFSYGASQDLYDTAKLLSQAEEPEGQRLDEMLDQIHQQYKVNE